MRTDSDMPSITALADEKCQKMAFWFHRRTHSVLTNFLTRCNYDDCIPVYLLRLIEFNLQSDNITNVEPDNAHKLHQTHTAQSP
jgi:hypothetical protein